MDLCTAKKATLNWRETIDDFELLEVNLLLLRLFVNITLALDWKLSVVRVISKKTTVFNKLQCQISKHGYWEIKEAMSL